MNLDILGLSGNGAAGQTRASASFVPAVTGDGGDFADIMAAEAASGKLEPGRSGAGRLGLLPVGENAPAVSPPVAQAVLPEGEGGAIPGVKDVVEDAVEGKGAQPFIPVPAPDSRTGEHGKTDAKDRDEADGLPDLSATSPVAEDQIAAVIPAAVPVAPPAPDTDVSGQPEDAPVRGAEGGRHQATPISAPDVRGQKDAAVVPAVRLADAAGVPASPSLSLPPASAPVAEGRGAAPVELPLPMPAEEAAPAAPVVAKEPAAVSPGEALPRAVASSPEGEGEEEGGPDKVVAPSAAPDISQKEKFSATRPGEATSLLDIVKSLLPGRGRASRADTAETGQESRAPAPMATDARTAPNSPPSTPAVLSGAMKPAAAPPERRSEAPLSMAVAAGKEGLTSSPVHSEGVKGAAMPSPAVAEQQAGKAEPPPVPLMTPRPVAEERREESAGEAVDRSAGSASSVASPSASPLFDPKTLGFSSAPTGSPSPLALNGASVAMGIGASLDQRVVDMGVSGQWIDDIARQIATIGDNPGRGSFQIASPNLGAVRVDITPGTQGSDIRLTAETEAAQIALLKDKGRLVQDAHLASVRVGELRIDRMAPVNESQRSETGHEGQGQGGSAQSGASQNGGQNMGQGGQPGTRQDMAGTSSGQYSDGNPKNPFTRSVISDAGAADTRKAPGEGRADTARYA